MKIRNLFAAAACAALLASCSGGDSAKSGDNLAGASAADSLIYYFGQIRASEYWREAANDSTLRDEAAIQAYMRGVRAGLDAVRQNDEQYNQGLFMGIQLAMNMSQFEKDYDIKLDRQALAKSMAEGLRNDSAVNMQEAQKGFYGVMAGLNAAREQRDREASAKALEAAGAKLGMEQVNPVLWAGKPVIHGPGTPLEQGDRVRVHIAATTESGAPINVRMPGEVTIGDRYVSAPIGDAVAAMHLGEKRRFATTASTLFSSRASQLHLEPSEIVLLSIEVSPELTKKGEQQEVQGHQVLTPSQINGR